MDKYPSADGERRSSCIDTRIVFIVTWAAFACLCNSQEDFKGRRQ